MVVYVVYGAEPTHYGMVGAVKCKEDVLKLEAWLLANGSGIRVLRAADPVGVTLVTSLRLGVAFV
eukprot:7827137-Pyramimonas_sp.AAC.3